MPWRTRHALLLGVALLPTLNSAGQTPSFRAGIDLIEVPAVVRDRDGWSREKVMSSRRARPAL